MAMEGYGFFDPFIRMGYSSEAERTLNELGDKVITRITLSRAPIRKILRKVLNAISFGRFEQTIASYGYDKLYHLAMLCEVGNRRVDIEKTATVVVTTHIKHEPNAEFIEVPLNGQQIILSNLLDRGKAFMGDYRFWTYNYETNNCQVFIDSILKANGLLTDDIHKWLFQDLPGISGKIGPIANAIANTATDVGATINSLIGQGVAPLEAVVHAHVANIKRKQRAPRRRMVGAGKVPLPVTMDAILASRATEKPPYRTDKELADIYPHLKNLIDADAAQYMLDVHRQMNSNEIKWFKDLETTIVKKARDKRLTVDDLLDMINDLVEDMPDYEGDGLASSKPKALRSGSSLETIRTFVRNAISAEITRYEIQHGRKLNEAETKFFSYLLAAMLNHAASSSETKESLLMFIQHYVNTMPADISGSGLTQSKPLSRVPGRTHVSYREASELMDTPFYATASTYDKAQRLIDHFDKARVDYRLFAARHGRPPLTAKEENELTAILRSVLLSVQDRLVLSTEDELKARIDDFFRVLKESPARPTLIVREPTAGEGLRRRRAPRSRKTHVME